MDNFGIIIGLTALYFASILGFVLYARVKATNSLLPGLNEFFLAGRTLSPVVLLATYIATLFSTFSVLGMPGLTYAHGIGGPLMIFLWSIPAAIFIYFVGKKVRRFAEGKRIFSPVEIISQTYDSRILGLFIAVILAILLIPYISLQLVAVGAFIEAYTDGQVTYLLGVGSMMAIILIYLFLGGMRAVAYTDFIQLTAMIVGLTIGAIFLFGHYDVSISDVFAKIRAESPEHLSLPGPKNYFDIPMLLTSVMVVLGLMIQPHLLTRTMMAKSDKEISMMAYGTIAGAIIVNVFFALLYAFFAYYNWGGDLPSNLMMGTVFKDMASIGLFGLILSTFMLMGVLGASMSTADSLLISIGQVSTRDMVRPFFKMTPQKQVLLSKGIMSVVLVGAFMIGVKPPQYMTDLAIYSAAGCSVLVPTFMCFEWKRRCKLASYLSIIVGLVLFAITVPYKLNTGISYGGVHPGTIPMVASFIIYFGICFLKKTVLTEK